MKKSLFGPDSRLHKFYIPPCSQKRSVSKLITDNGGIIVTKQSDAELSLLPHGSTESSKKRYPTCSVGFIKACVEQMDLLDPFEFPIKPTISTVSESVNIQKNPRRGRNAYTKEEEAEMIMWFKKYGNMAAPKGIKIWNYAIESNPILRGRSAQSLQEHWQKALLTRESQWEIDFPVNIIEATFNPRVERWRSKKRAKITDDRSDNRSSDIPNITINVTDDIIEESETDLETNNETADIPETAEVSETADISESAEVSETADISESAEVSETADISDIECTTPPKNRLIDRII
eukprot:GHVL01020736.1.p1 GENE.GHVL01020736.1~~GHVL01020736.1.p1  ORF type:complete len:293 (+),score=76.94 GHVL01020736.1:78-956(+)